MQYVAVPQDNGDGGGGGGPTALKVLPWSSAVSSVPACVSESHTCAARHAATGVHTV